jgi:serine/threonine protein phosphatase PrpC
MEDAAGGLDYGPHAGCYVVADGHGGAAVARLAVDALPTLLARSLAATTGGDGDVRAALVDAFRACEARCGALTGGACVVLALLLGDDLFVAHCGDCRAVLDRDGDEGWTWSRAHGPAPDALAGPFAGGVARLTKDHVPAGREAARVARAGGRLLETRDGKVRVGRTVGPGGLAVSRALGDADEYRGVVAAPDVAGPVRLGPGQEKRAKFPTSKAPISAVFHSFRLISGRAIISRNGLEAWMLFPERACAEHSR